MHSHFILFVRLAIAIGRVPLRAAMNNPHGLPCWGLLEFHLNLDRVFRVARGRHGCSDSAEEESDFDLRTKSGIHEW